MDVYTRLVAAKLTGRLTVEVAIGRIDYSGRFQPFGVTPDVLAMIHQTADNETYIKGDVDVAYAWDSPRIITHVGVLIADQWLLEQLPTFRHLSKGDAMRIRFVRVLGKFGNGPTKDDE